MRIGTINYATEQGLGILVKDFFDNGILNDVMVVRHSSRKTHEEWYPKTKISTGQKSMKEFVRSLDVFFIFETPFDWDLIPFCKEHGVKTVLMPMYECMPSELPHQPDKIINPSLLDQQYYPSGEFIPVPVNVQWRLRNKANVFVHNAGNLGLRGRNGTAELIESIRYVKNQDIKLILRCQKQPDLPKKLDPRIDLRPGTVPYEQLYSEGDVFIFPEKFNGLSLPLQEARAAGMVVMATDRFPMNTWLPRSPLIPISGTSRARIGGCNPFDEAIIDPKDIALCIDGLSTQNEPGVIEQYSQGGRAWAMKMSWSELAPRYLRALETA